MPKIRIDGADFFHERRDWFDDPSLTDAATACIDAQRRAAASARAAFQPNPGAEVEVSPERLAEILDAGGDIHGISSDRSISNVIPFNAKHLNDAVNSPEVAALRERVDAMVIDRLRDTFEEGSRLTATSSGHFWYPPGAYMAWHTNSGAPGWRIYLTHAAEPGRSFFRYRRPTDGEIVTSLDHAWDVRLFRIDPEVPLWHAVFSQTDRFSLGYLLRTKRPLRALVGKVKKALRAD
mgnify:CR=1 FL=1